MVAVAAAAKEHDQAAACEGAHGGQHVLQRVGRMGVVENHLVRRAGVEDFHTARHVLHAFQALADRAFVDAHNHRQRGGGQGVVDVEHAGQMHGDGHVLQAAQLDGEGHAVLGDFDVARKHVRLGADAVGEVGHLEVADDGGAGFVVGIERGVQGRSLDEKPLLGFKVVFHGAEVVQMVLRKIGVARGLKGDAVHAVHIHGMGADLHAHGLHALVHHLPEAPVQIDRIGRGHVAGQAAVTDQIAGGADQAGLEARFFQNGLHQIGRGGFALGAAHAHHA